MLQLLAPILENVALAERTFRIRFRAPALAEQIRPGQFVMIRLPHRTDPLLGRPFALYDILPDQQAIDVVYLVVGKMTSMMSSIPVGESLEIWGPLGNGFVTPQTETINLVAGGIGQTPFLALTHDLLGAQGYGGSPATPKVKRVNLFYGVRNAHYLAGIDDFRRAGANLYLATDDGSEGFHGFVTQLLERESPSGEIVGCGPEPMLKSLARIAAKWNRTCYVSLETPMACGFGACFSCVTPVKCESGWDYKRVCVEGPVFDASRLKWE